MRICGLFKVFQSFLVLGLLGLFSASSAMADDYSPGSVILLKKENRDLKTPEQKLDEGKREGAKNNIPKEDSTNIGNGVNIYPNSTPPLVVQPMQQLGANAPEDKVTQAYASHMFMGICAQGYRDQMAPQMATNVNPAQLWALAQKSCQCLSSAVLSAVQATDLADYVMYNYSYQDPTNPNPAVDQYRNTAKVGVIANLISDPGMRSKCGFLK